ncbi:MAG: MFS transporter, partial [bacterium]
TAHGGAGIPEDPDSRTPWFSMGLLFLAHFIVDSQVSFLASLLPLLRDKFHLTLGAAGVLVYLLNMCNAGGQPLMSILVDRWPRMPWLAIGLIGSAFFLTSIGWLPRFTLLAAAIPIGGLLAGLAHPDMASRAGALSERHRSLSVSVFVSGGRLGFSLGPLIALFIAKRWGMEWLWLYVLVNVAAVAAVMGGLPRPVPSARTEKGFAILRGLGRAIRKAGSPIFILVGVTIFRAVCTINMQSFLPTIYVERGMGLWRGGIANSILLFFGMIGVVAGGALAGRIGKKKVIVSGIILSFFGLVAFLTAPPAIGFLVTGMLGFALYMPMGVSMAYAQDFLPEHRGFASALTLGVSWGVASFSVLPISKIAEGIGLFQAFWALPVSLLVALCFSAFLPKEAGA